MPPATQRRETVAENAVRHCLTSVDIDAARVMCFPQAVTATVARRRDPSWVPTCCWKSSRYVNRNYTQKSMCVHIIFRFWSLSTQQNSLVRPYLDRGLRTNALILV